MLGLFNSFNYPFFGVGIKSPVDLFIGQDAVYSSAHHHTTIFKDFAKILSSGLTTQNREGKPEITVVNIQKFSNDSKALPKNAYNVPVQRIYFIDEAHRNYSPDGCFLKNLISSDGKAVKIALTGTPIISGKATLI